VSDITDVLISYSRLLSALMLFSMDLHLSSAELRSMKYLERYSARHISAVNDITSWEKEVKASGSGHHEGSVLCSAVKVAMEEIGVGVEPAKRMLWLMAREWEEVFNGIVRERLEAGCGQAVKDYMQGLEYQMSGNERWSLTTLRYHDLV
jgi:aristolochene synthase